MATQYKTKDVQPHGGAAKPTSTTVKASTPAPKKTTTSTPTAAKPTTKSTAAVVSSTSIEQQISEQYGYLSAYMNIPDIKAILVDAVTNHLSQEKIQAKLYTTNWWKQTQQSVRQWDALSALDPSSARSQIDKQKANLYDMAGKMGVSLNDHTLEQIATDALRQGWDQTQITDRLIGELNFTGPATGQVSETQLAIKHMADDYLVDVDQPTLQSWTRQVLGGSADVEGFRQYLIDMSGSQYTGAAETIKNGATTTKQFYDPYASSAAELLGITKDQVDFKQDKWRRALMQTDPKDGTRKSLSIDQFNTLIKTDQAYGYNDSLNGKQEAASFTQKLGERFGYNV